jgi:hypothetical protein
LLAVVLVLVGLSSTLIGTSVTLHGLSPGRPAELNPMHMQLLKRMFGFQEPEPDPDDHEETCNGKSPVGGHNLPSSASAQESPTTRVP